MTLLAGFLQLAVGLVAVLVLVAALVFILRGIRELQATTARPRARPRPRPAP
jgi:hypothetical protein